MHDAPRPTEPGDHRETTTMTDADLVHAALEHAPELAPLAAAVLDGTVTWDAYAEAFPAGRPRAAGARGWARSVIGSVAVATVDGLADRSYALDCYARMIEG